MSAQDLPSLVNNAKGGNHDAVTAFIMAIARDLRAFIGTFAASSAMLEDVHTATWMQVRREITACPPSSQVVTWIRQRAMVIIQHRLEQERNQAIAAKDGLRHLLAQDGIEGLQSLISPSNDCATHINTQYPQIDEAAQILIHRRYAENATLDELATEMQLNGPGEVAIRLYTARASLHWRAIEGDKRAPEDRLFPGVIEQHIACSITPEARQQLAQSLLKDLGRAAGFTRQMRVDMLLRAIFGDYSEEAAAQLATTMGKIEQKRRNESSLLHVAPPARTPIGSGSELIRSQERIAERQTRTPSTPRPGYQGGRPVASRRRMTSNDQRTTDVHYRRSGRRKLPPAALIIGGVIAVGILTLIIMWVGGDERHAGSQGSSSNGSKVATVLGFQSAYTLLDGQNEKPGNLGAEIIAGQGVRSGNGETTVELSNISRLVLSANTEIRSFDQLSDGTGQAKLDKGQVKVQALAAPGIEILTLQTRISFGVARGSVTVDADRTIVQSLTGPITVTAIDGSGLITVPAGASVIALTGAAPRLIQPRAYVRGINFGGNNVTIDNQKWLSQRQALTAGMELANGTDIASLGALSGAGLDFDRKSMLDSGLSSTRTPVEITQKIPNGEFDVTLWLGNTTPSTANQLAIYVNDKRIEFGELYLPRSGWAQLGPITLSVSNEKLNIRIDGLGTGRMSGILLEAPGGGDIQLPPAIAISSPGDAATFFNADTIPVQAEVLGTVKSVKFFANNEQIGEATEAPYRIMAKKLPPGDYKLTAQALYGNAQKSTSLPLGISIQEAFGSGALVFHMWDKVIAKSVDDAIKNNRITGKPTATYKASKFESKTNWGDNLFIRARGYVHAPMTGKYTFWHACNDAGEIWLSTDDSPTNIKKITSNSIHSEGQQNWDKHASQKSMPIELVRGKRYFIEFRYIENSINDYGAVGWQLPNGVMDRPISGAHLSPADNP